MTAFLLYQAALTAVSGMRRPSRCGSITRRQLLASWRGRALRLPAAVPVAGGQG
ncbi:hypothetical protein PS9374_07123 [Planomonospora sphaerica]|uniref:Uncharacterized protein n=1 Tax=Planomonospora sphaerica TaxID=161355 RepID=A0A171DQU8_9ACTN|nr:hypothetical protein [Planomonospora sphaerica]GAT71432.1 hypothetical protein PS9374_07123 [Planomonospora sphaerica]